MHDIEFNAEEVRRFQTDSRTIGREIVAMQDALRKSLATASSYWQDESITLATARVNEIDRKMRAALAQIDTVIGGALRRQLEFAERYRRIR
jgi:hypothetical protein